MKTKMNKLLLVPVVLGIISALGDTTTTPPTNTTKAATTTSAWTTGHSGLNLNGKMFTLSLYGGGISFYPAHYSPTSTHPWTTNNPYTTTPPSTRGVSVCVRYITDWPVQSFSFFTLSPSTTPLSLGASSSNSYSLSYDKYGSMTQSFRPDIWFFTDLGLDIWTSVCVTVDSMKNTTQMFVGPHMSIKKLLPGKYVWSGEPVIQFSGFDGQLTNIQVWDYPLSYSEVHSYMASTYTPYRGSVLTWSFISYFARGNVLLDDVYWWQEKQPISRQGQRRRLKNKKKHLEENIESQRQQL